MIDTRYVRTAEGVYLAYQTSGSGPIDLTWTFEPVRTIDLAWEHPGLGAWLRGLASFARVVLHDPRGTGMSSRDVPIGDLETRVADQRAVLDAAGSRRPVLGGSFEGGAINLVHAATDPNAVRSLVWWSPVVKTLAAPDAPWGISPQWLDEYLHHIERAWGTEGYDRLGPETFESERVAGEWRRAAGRLTRHTATPDVAIRMARIWAETDVREILPAVSVPTLVLATRDDPSAIAEAEFVVSRLPQAELRMVPGHADSPSTQAPVLAEIQRWLGIDSEPDGLDTVLATVLFTDIVASTERQAAMGDAAWTELVERHHASVRGALDRWRGREVSTAGDGFFSIFDGPARAVRCAAEIVDRVADLGLSVRAGVHIGEVGRIDGEIGGLAVNIGARIGALAGPSEVLVSQTVKDLVAGSGLVFEEAGVHELKGVPDAWRLYRVVR